MFSDVDADVPDSQDSQYYRRGGITENLHVAGSIVGSELSQHPR